LWQLLFPFIETTHNNENDFHKIIKTFYKVLKKEIYIFKKLHKIIVKKVIDKACNENNALDDNTLFVFWKELLTTILLQLQNEENKPILAIEEKENH